ncbi:MAG: hypothetical protein WBK67_02370 [Minisyncoccales bacterium]
MGMQSTRDTLIRKIEEVANTSTDLEQLSYAGASLAKLVDINFDVLPQDDAYKMFKPNGFGNGVAAMPDEYLPAGYIKLTGHADTAHPNHGKVMDEHGSVFNYRAPFYYKMTGNIISVSNVAVAGYVKPYAFTIEPKGFLFSAFTMGNEGGKLVSKQFLAPVSTSSANNPISNLLSNVANNYAGYVDACLAMGYKAPTVFEWEVLRLVSLAQSQSGASSALVAFNDVAPFFPKGNNNNALKDVNDTSVSFTAGGYSNCALSGSASNFAKSTDNGQACGTADVNGNVWKIVTGLTYLAKTGATCANGGTAVAMPAHGLAVNDVIYFGGTPTSGSTYDTAAYTVTAVTDANNFTVGAPLSREILSTNGVYSPRFFRMLKQSLKANTLTSTTLLSEANYDLLNLTGIIDSNSGTTLLGNGTNTVLNFSTDVNSLEYKMASVLIPTATGTSVAGTTEFGNDILIKRMVHGLVVIVGGSWSNTATAGVFSAYLSHYSASSHPGVGGFASVSLS